MKKPTISSLKKKLWKIFAIYIKNRDKWTCVTCGKRAEGQGMNAGHYIAKAACSPVYYFSEENVNAQCFRCNMMLEGNRPLYRDFIIRKYGEEILDDIEKNYNKSVQWSVADYLDKIRYYKSMV